MSDYREMRKKNIKKYIHYFLLLVGMLILIILLFCLPDIIWTIRNLIAGIPILKRFLLSQNVNFTYNQYIPMMLTILNCIVTASVAFGAYQLSQVLGKIQLEDHDSKCMLWALKVSSYIKKNMDAIHKYINGVGNLSALQHIDAEEYMITIINLQSCKIIEQVDRKILIDLIKEFQNLQEKTQQGDLNAASKIVEEIKTQHIQLEPIFSLTKPLKSIIEKLDTASKEEDNND